MPSSRPSRRQLALPLALLTLAACGRGAEPPSEDVLRPVASIVLGSGINPHNLADFWAPADGFIIGSYFKQDGFWANPVDPTRIETMMERARDLAHTCEPG